MQPITEKDTEIINQWYEDASKQTLETLPEFMRHVLNEYYHDYGTIVKAIGACSIAAAWAANASPQGGITNFQAGYVMWEFIMHWNHKDNKTGMRIIDYDDMLYPHHEDRFNKTIPKRSMESLANEAKKLLAKHENNEQSLATPAILAHWKSIAQGVPPFGYRVINDE